MLFRSREKEHVEKKVKKVPSFDISEFIRQATQKFQEDLMKQVSVLIKEKATDKKPIIKAEESVRHRKVHRPHPEHRKVSHPKIHDEEKQPPKSPRIEHRHVIHKRSPHAEPKVMSEKHKKHHGIKSEEYFILSNGHKLKSIRGLFNALDAMDDSVFYHHVTPTTNDFSNWIEYVFKEKYLADKLRSCKNKAEMKDILGLWLHL